MRKIKPFVVDVLCEYWVRKLSGKLEHDNGDDSFAGSIFKVLLDVQSEKNRPTVEQLEIFRKELEKQIKSSKWDDIDLYCDYDPGYMLAESAEKANINKIVFPYKTGINYKANLNLITECKYRAKFSDKIIFCTKDYILEHIQYLKESLKKNRAEGFKYFTNVEEGEKQYKQEIAEFEELSSKAEDYYVRDDFKDFFSNYKKKEIVDWKR